MLQILFFVETFNIIALSNNKNIKNYHNFILDQTSTNLIKINNPNKIYNYLENADLIFIDKDMYINNIQKKLLNLYLIPTIEYKNLGYIHDIKIKNNDPFFFYIDTIDDKKIKMYKHKSNLKFITSKTFLDKNDIIKIDNNIKTIDNLNNLINVKFKDENKKFKFNNTNDFIYYMIFKKINERFYLENSYSI